MRRLLLLIPGAVLAAGAMLANAAAFRPSTDREEVPDGQAVTFCSGRRRLAGYIWNQSGTRGRIVMAHGMGTSMGYYLPEVRHFADQGYQVFSFAYRGYGKSTGHFRGFAQAVSDLQHAVEFIDDGTLPLILFGHSMGGYAVCAAAQCLNRPIDAIVAYAPFYASGDAIAEMTHRMSKCAGLLRFLILPVQYVLFGARHRLNGVDGLRAANAPALILQGSRDEEVRCDGCSLYAHRRELAGSAVTFRLIEREDSCGHMTVIRKKGTRCVNEDTIKIVDSFLDEVLDRIRGKSGETESGRRKQ